MIGGLFRAIAGAAQWAGRRLAMRSKWLAKRLWVITVAEIALTARRHWKRLTPEERDRLVELARKSHGRPSRNLKRGEREELSRLLDKLGHWELAASAVATALPFGGGLFRRLAPKSRQAEPKAELPPP
jgi:hypothetical protein